MGDAAEAIRAGKAPPPRKEAKTQEGAGHACRCAGQRPHCKSRPQALRLSAVITTKYNGKSPTVFQSTVKKRTGKEVGDSDLPAYKTYSKHISLPLHYFVGQVVLYAGGEAYW